MRQVRAACAGNGEGWLSARRSDARRSRRLSALDTMVALAALAAVPLLLLKLRLLRALDERAAPYRSPIRR